MITTVIFDVDGTLYDYDAGHEAAMEALCMYTKAHFNRSASDTRETFRRAFQYMTECLGHTAASHNRLLRTQQMLIWWNEPVIPHAMNMARLYWDTLISVSKPMPGLIPLMQALKCRGICIGVGTNMTAMIQFQKLDALGLSPFIDFVVTSEQCTVEKPEKPFFDLCLAVGNCKAEETIFVGDSLKNDYYGSVDAGMHGIWYTPDTSYGSQAEKKEPTEYQDIPQIHNYHNCLNGENLVMGDLTLSPLPQ